MKNKISDNMWIMLLNKIEQNITKANDLLDNHHNNDEWLVVDDKFTKIYDKGIFDVITLNYTPLSKQEADMVLQKFAPANNLTSIAVHHFIKKFLDKEIGIYSKIQEIISTNNMNTKFKIMTTLFDFMNI